MIQKLKMELSKMFDMKDLGDRKVNKLRLSQESYIERMLERFNMKNSNPISTPLPGHFKLSKRLPIYGERKRRNVSHSILIHSWKSVYAMVCTCSNISHVVGVVTRFLTNPCKAH